MGGDAAAHIMDAVEQPARRHARGGEDDVARGHFLKLVLLVEVLDAHFRGAGLLLFLLGDETALHLAADAAQRRGRQHAFGRTALTDIDVDAGIGIRRRDHAGHVAIGDELHPGACLTHLADKLRMAGAVENAGRDLFDGHALFLGQRADIVGGIGIEIDKALGIAAADGDLVHIGVGRVQERAALRRREHGHRIRHRLGGQRRAFQRIERDIDFRTFARADLLADVEHGRFVAFALADHHNAVDVEDVQFLTHGIDRGLVGLLLVAAAHPERRHDSRAFRYARHLQRQHSVQTFRFRRHADPRLVRPIAGHQVQISFSSFSEARHPRYGSSTARPPHLHGPSTTPWRAPWSPRRIHA